MNKLKGIVKIQQCYITRYYAYIMEHAIRYKFKNIFILPLLLSSLSWVIPIRDS